MIAPTLDVDVSDMTSDLEALARELKQPVTRVLRERSGFFARYLAESTFPLADADAGGAFTSETTNVDGGSTAAQKVGQAAVRRDIGRVYVPITKFYAELERRVGRRVARAFAKLVRTDILKAQAIIAQAGIRGASLEFIEWDGGDRHRRLRNKRGGINRGVRPVLVGDVASLKKYIRSREKRVGFAKSGWITAGRSIPGAKIGGVSKWISQGAPGRGTDHTDDDIYPAIHLENRVSYIDRAFGQKQYARVQQAFSESLAKRLAIELEKTIEKKNRATLARAASSR